MFSEDAHYEFLKRYYRAEFFEGRNGSIWGINYSYNLARVGMNMLERYGNDSNLLIVFYVQIVPDDFVMQLHRF